MPLETEAVIDRRLLRRKLAAWRAGAIVAAVVALGAVGAATGGMQIAGQREIARVAIEGLITEDREQLQMLKRLAEDRQVAGVILAINSGGGTTTGGEALFEAIRQIAKAKPVVAQFGTVAASAAYICGLGADHIVARGNSLTGSVGVIMQWPEVSGLLDKVGVKFNEIRSGPLKAVPSTFEPISTDGRRVAEEMVAEGQRWFLGLVKSRRGIDTAAVPGLEQGRVYSGREALTFKLVDEIGGEAEAVRWLEAQPAMAKGLKIVTWKPRTTSGSVLGWFGSAAAVATMLTGSDATVNLSIDALKSRFGLDGLVSVWQPHEK